MTLLFATAIATAAFMVAGPAATANPVFGLGHYNEGDRDTTNQEYDRFDDCLSDHEHESNEISEEDIEHCIDLAYHGESDESSREDNSDSDGDESNRQDDDEDENESEEDIAFFGDDSVDPDISGNDFNGEHDSADGENSSTDY